MKTNSIGETTLISEAKIIILTLAVSYPERLSEIRTLLDNLEAVSKDDSPENWAVFH